MYSHRLTHTLLELWENRTTKTVKGAKETKIQNERKEKIMKCTQDGTWSVKVKWLTSVPFLSGSSVENCMINDLCMNTYFMKQDGCWDTPILLQPLWNSRRTNKIIHSLYYNVDLLVWTYRSTVSTSFAYEGLSRNILH